jgi:23S rRNA (guanosine2251-2'-O)-methyltransferase
MIITGRNAISEALKGGITIEKVLAQEDHSPSLNRILSACKKNKIKLSFVSKTVLDRVSGVKNHQGIVAYATDFKYSSMDDILSNEKKKLILILDGIEDPHNLGSIIRTADAAGADGIIIPKHRSCGVTDIVIKVSSGAAAHVKIAKVTNINDAIRSLKELGIWIYAADMDGEELYQSDLKVDMALIIGGEGKGISSLTKKLADKTIALPLLGKINSLNAGVAAGAILYECVRQRRQQ